MKYLLQKIRKLLAPFPLILNIFRILKDSRYLYHILQGKFISIRSREYLRGLEKIFFKERVTLKDFFHDPGIKKEQYYSFVDEGILINPITIESGVVENIKEGLHDFLCHDPERNELGYFLIQDKPKDISRAYYQCEDLG